MATDPARATIEDLTRKVTITTEQRDTAYKRIEEMAVQQREFLRQLAEKDATVRTLLDIISDYTTEQYYRTHGVLPHLRVGQKVREGDLMTGKTDHTVTSSYPAEDGVGVEGLPPFID